MNEQLQQAIAELIGKAVEGADAATNFLSAEIPDFVSQLLLWYGVISFIQMMFGLIAIVCALVLPPIIYKHGDNACNRIENKDKKEHTAMYYWLLIWFVIFAGIIGSFNINLEWLQIWVAPKVWLAEYAATMVK